MSIAVTNNSRSPLPHSSRRTAPEDEPRTIGYTGIFPIVDFPTGKTERYQTLHALNHHRPAIYHNMESTDAARRPLSEPTHRLHPSRPLRRQGSRRTAGCSVIIRTPRSPGSSSPVPASAADGESHDGRRAVRYNRSHHHSQPKTPQPARHSHPIEISSPGAGYCNSPRSTQQEMTAPA